MCVLVLINLYAAYILIMKYFTDGYMHTQTLTHRSSNTQKCIFTNDAMLYLKLTCHLQHGDICYCLFIFCDEGENILEHFNQVKIH